MDVPVTESDNVVTNGDTSTRGGPLPPPSPLTGCYLLIVLGEPYSEEHKEIILQRIAKGLLSWDIENCHVDLEKELQAITDVAPEGEEARHGERLIQFATENLVTEVLIHPAANTLIQCMKNLLSSFTRHRHIIHSGYTFGGNGSWALQDGTFSLADFTEAFQENEVQRVIKAYENTITIDIHCSSEGDWSKLPKETYTKSCKVQVNPNDVLTSGSPSINSFLNYLSPFLMPADIESLLESSDVVGNIRFSHPTLYVFPGGQGDAALFGINGFNMLVDGGYARKACFWDFTRHLDRLDAVLVTRVNNSNVCGVSSVLKRKTNNQVYPQIGHFFCNLQERKAISPDGDKDRDPLLINLLDEGQDIISNLRQLNLRPQLCYRDTDPINLYHKVGHGTLDMYVLSPAKDSKEVKEFLHKWNTNDQRLFATRKDPKEFSFPLSNLVSICALLVWKPANPSDTITRLLFPGSTPQHKIFEGLDRLKHLEFMKHPVCSAKSLTPSGSILGLTKSKQTKTTTVLDKILPSEHRTQKILDMKPLKERTPPQNENKQRVENKNENKKLIEMNGTASEENKISKIEKVIKSNSVESDKSEPGSDSKKTDMTNGKDVEIILEDKSDPKPKTKVTETKPRQRMSSKARSESSTRRSVEKKPKIERKVESKPSPPTPKKTLEAKVNGVTKEKDVPKQKLLNRTGLKSSPTSTPAKSTKDANNRKVVESKYKPAPKKEPIAKKEPPKLYERKPISRRLKAASPVRTTKVPASPSKKLSGVKTDKNGVSRTIKLDKEGTTDSSAVSTPSADQDTSKKIDESKLTKTELEELKAKELADLKEEQEVVKEIEAVFRKDEKLNESDQPDLRKIKDVSIEEKTTEAEDEEEEYLIVEKEEVEQNTDSVNEQESATKEDEIQKHQRDSEESEKQRKGSDAEKTDEKIPIVEEVPAKIEPEIQETKLIEAETCKVLEIVQPAVKEEEEIIIPTAEMTRSKEDSREKTEEMSKEISVTSPEDKIDMSSEKKLTDTRGDVEEEENKEEKDQNYVLESQPDEKFSATIESGATTAPTLPEDERITLDEIKEDQVIEEKYVKEETKEEKEEVPAVVITQKPLETVPKISPIVGIKFEAHQSHIRDIVKTPDEVADLPMHEEVDIDTYDFPSAFKKDNKKVEPVPLKESDDVTKPVIELISKEKVNEIVVEDKTAVVKESKEEEKSHEELQKDDKDDGKDKEDETQDITTDTKITVVIVQASEMTEEIETLEKEKDSEPQEIKQDHIESSAKSAKETESADKDIKPESTEIKQEDKIDEQAEKVEVDTKEKITEVKDTIQEAETEIKQDTTEFETDNAVEKDGTEDVKVELKKDEDNSIVTQMVAEVEEKAGVILTTIKDAIEEITASVKDDVKLEDDVNELKKEINKDLPETTASEEVEVTKEISSADNEIEIKEIVNEGECVTNDADVLTTETKQQGSDKNTVISDAKEIITDIIKEAERKTSVVDDTQIDLPVSAEPETENKIDTIDESQVDSKLDTAPEKLEENDDIIEETYVEGKHPYKEEEIVKIVSSVAHVLKSDAPLEELASTLPIEYGSPFKSFGLKGYTTELRETHITTLDSPVQEDAALPGHETHREDFSVCPKQSSIDFIDEEKKIAIEETTVPETQDTDISPQEKKISDLIKDSNALIASTSKIISEIKSGSVVDSVITEEHESKEESDKPEDDINDMEAMDETEDALTRNTTGTVHRMLVTASSEDGGEETVICPTGSITFTKEDSGKSSPDNAVSAKSPPPDSLSARSTPEPTEKESIVDSKDEAQIQENKLEETVEQIGELEVISENKDNKIEKDTKETEIKTKEDAPKEDIVSSGKSSPKLSDDKIMLSGKSTPDIKTEVDKTAEELTDNIDADIKSEEKISKDDHETEKTDKDLVDTNATETKGIKKAEHADVTDIKIELKEDKQLITDKTSPDIKDEISDTSTKEDIETVKELSPMTTEHVDIKADDNETIEMDTEKVIPDQQIKGAVVSKIAEIVTVSVTSVDSPRPSVDLGKDQGLKSEETSKLEADVKEDTECLEDVIEEIETEIKSEVTTTTENIKNKISDTDKQSDLNVDLKEDKEISEKIQHELEEQKKQIEVEVDDVKNEEATEQQDEIESVETLPEAKTPDLKDTKDEQEDIKTELKATAREVKDDQSSIPEPKAETKESSGKATPDLKGDSLSGSESPALKIDLTLASGKTTPDLKRDLKEEISTIEKSGKSTPDSALETSGKATPDAKENLQVETKVLSGKSTPDIKDVPSGKATPDINEDIGLKVDEILPSGKSTPDVVKDASGKSSPLLGDTKMEETPSLSGKSSPRPESDIKEQSNELEVSPELKDDKSETSGTESLETRVEEIFDKTTEIVPVEDNADKKEQKSSSGKTSPEFNLQDVQSASKASISETTVKEQVSAQLSPHENNIGEGDSGKSSPDLKCDRSKSILSVTSEKSGKLTPDIKSEHITPIATPEIHDIKDVSGKSTPDIKLTDRKSIISITSEQSGKSTPDVDLKPDDLPGGLTLDVHDTKDLSGRSTPEIKIDLLCDQSGKSSPDLQEHVSDIQDIIADSTPDMKPGDRKYIVSITSEQSGKSTPDLKADHVSPIATPDIQDIKGESGKSTPDIKPGERKSITSLTSEQSGKTTPADHVSPRATPDIHDIKSESGKSTPDVVPLEKTQSSIELVDTKSGKSTPEVNAPTPEVKDIKTESGKSTPDIKHETRKSITSVTSEKSGKSTPDIKATTPEIQDIKSESGKSTPDIQCEISKSGKATPDIQARTPEVHDIKSESGKATPDIKCEVSETITLVTSEKSGKSTPDIKSTTPEVHDFQSGKSTPDIKCETRKSIISETIEKSGISTPDIQASSPEIHDIKTESGKSTPDINSDVAKTAASIISEQSGKSTPDIIALSPDIHSSKAESGKSTPDVKCDISETTDVVTSVKSGKSTPDIKATTPEVHDFKLESGKSTPDIKNESRKSIISVTSDKSGKSTPDIKATSPEIHDIKVESGKSTPDIKCEVSKIDASATSEQSGKSTPDIQGKKPEAHDIQSESGKITPDTKSEVEKITASVINEQSRKSTPDIMKEINETISSLANEQSGISTPDLKASALPDDSGKSTPDIKCEIRKSIVSITSDISGKSTPDLKDNDVSARATPDIHGLLDKSGKSTPDLQCEINKTAASVTSDQSGKSTPDHVRSTPDIYDVYGRSTPDKKCDMRKTMVSITNEQSGKSTPDLKHDEVSANGTPDIHELDKSGISTPDIKVVERKSFVSVTSEQSGKSTPDLKDKSATPELPISIDIKGLSGISTPDLQETEQTKSEAMVEKEVKTHLKIVLPCEKDNKEAQSTVTTTELSVAGPSNLLREDSIPSSGQISPLNKEIIHLSSEELHLSGKSTPDIADVERMKEIHEILKHEKHIPGSSTPPTVPVSPIVKETFTLQAEEQKITEKKELSSVKEKEHVDEKETDTTQKETSISEAVKPSGVTTTTTTTTVTKKIVDDLQITKDITEVSTTKDGTEVTQKSTDLRCSTPGSDDCDFGGVSSPHSDISSGQMSRVAHAWGHGSSEERQAYSDDDDVPGSPTSVTSQMEHSPTTRYTEFEAGSDKSAKIDPMISSFYGALPDDSAEESSVTSSDSKVQSQPIPITTKTHLEYSAKEAEKRFQDDADLDFEKAMLEHRQARGTDLLSGSTSDSPSYKYEITQAKYSKEIKEKSMENGKDGIAMKEIAKNGFDTDLESDHNIKTDSPKKSSPEMMTSSFIEASSSSSSQQSDIKKDPIETWGKPLGLPSPALPPTSDMSNKTTPKKIPPSATLAAKNKINDERKRSESPSKYKKNKNNNPVYLDLTYVPHHGNSYYSFVEFFKRVRARYYVFSGTEPSRDVYNALLEAKQTWEDKELEVTIIPTYDTDVLGYWVAENEDLLAKYKIDLSPSASRCTINLQDHETSCSAYRLEF